MIQSNEHYLVSSSGKKILIIEDGDDWEKVCCSVKGNRYDFIFVPQEFSNQACYFLPLITSQGKQIGKLCTYKVLT